MILSFLLLFIFVSQATTDDECNPSSDINTNPDLSNFMDGFNEIGSLMRGEKSADADSAKILGLGYLSYQKVAAKVASEIPGKQQLVFKAGAALLDVLVPSGPSQELKCMRQEFQKINQKLDDVKEEVQKLAASVKQGFEEMKKILTTEGEKTRLQQNVIHVFDRYNEHRNVLKALRFYNNRFLNEPSKKNQEELLKVCIIPQNRPLLQLAYLNSLVNEKQFGPDFLPTLYEFSQCDPSVYLGFTSMIMDDVAELIQLFKVCSTLELGKEKKGNPRAGASKYDAILLQKLFRKIQAGMLADEIMRQGKCFQKWLIVREDFYDEQRAWRPMWVDHDEWWKPAPGFPLIEADVQLANFPERRDYLLADPGCRMITSEISPTKQTGKFAAGGEVRYIFTYQIPSNRTMAFKMAGAYQDGYVCGFRVDVKLKTKVVNIIQPDHLCEVSIFPSLHCQRDEKLGEICCSHCEYKDNKILLDKVDSSCASACPSQRCDVDSCIYNITMRKTDPDCPMNW